MANEIRGIHVSPGVFSKETELQYAVKSLGITTLGVAGETLKGPAFEPISIENWDEFRNVFGGTSTEKFKASQYPKYELPYIAKSYLTQSKQLEVVRVLGLSGYNAGPAWAITASNGEEGSKNMVVAVIRSRGHYNAYEKYAPTESTCECGLSAHDKLRYEVGEFATVAECKYATHYNASALTISPYISLDEEGSECTKYYYGKDEKGFGISETNYGRFSLSGYTGAFEEWYEKDKKKISVEEYNKLSDEDKTKYTKSSKYNGNQFFYAVSLNPGDKDYILKVLGTNPHDGEAPIYVESLYDMALMQGIAEHKLTKIGGFLTFYDGFKVADFCTIPAVAGFVTKEEGALKRTDLGKRFLYAESSCPKTRAHRYKFTTSGLTWIDGVDLAQDEKSQTYEQNGVPMNEGQVYVVRAVLDKDNKRHYVYSYEVQSGATSGTTSADTQGKSDCLISGFSQNDDIQINITGITSKVNGSYVKNKSILVKNNTDNLYYRLTDKGVEYVSCDLNNYKSQYRFASTPWIVSNVKGDYNHLEVNKLFRFHTISDGNGANKEVKVSIKNILPDSGQFDVEIRAFDDSDAAPVVLESYGKCTLVPSDKNYIAYRIGSYDGLYETKSKYVTVEVNENLITKNSVPAGFLGYPLTNFGGTPIYGKAKKVTVGEDGNITVAGATNTVRPEIKYNCTYDVDIKNRKQYFGLSDITGVDVDMFTYKGKTAYIEEPGMLSNGFHLDCRLQDDTYNSGNTMVNTIEITVDGESGYTFDCVSVNNVTETLQSFPIIGSEDDMYGSIYEYTNLRKFTVCFYGGFDGWDEYRDERTIGDDFKYSQYKGQYNDATGEGLSFDRVDNADVIGLNQKSITSDWYAYLAAIRQFANPEETDINILATPGIDYVNNKLLVNEVIEMVEEERADSIYIVTTPDKPKGAGDYADEMYSAQEAVDNLDGSDIDSNYTATFFPWVKYHDTANNQYIYLPVTKDVVRNMAMTDNVSFPWFAPAGLERGDVDAVRAHMITKIADEDVLYENRINPVKTFAQDGVKIWGQKNLQVAESQLNRIAVRRLLLRMRKMIAVAVLGLIFEPGDSTTKDKFLSIVTPIMDGIRANRGISDYRIEVDDSIEARERYELPAKIYFKPYHALEYILLNFIVTPEGLSFEDI